MKIKSLILIIFSITIFANMSCTKKNGVLIQIQNDSQIVINHISLKFTGGEEIIRELQPNEKYKFTINPSGESALFISYNEEDNIFKKKIDTYIEPNYKGFLIIKIHNKGNILWEDNIIL